MIVYLAGPMTGIADFNYPAFNKMATRIRAQHYTVVNPAEDFGGAIVTPAGRKAFIRKDIHHVLCVDAVAVLPGWNIAGSFANIEVALALELGLPVYNAESLAQGKMEKVFPTNG